MRSSAFERLLLVAAILMIPSAVLAQEATLSGTVTDSTGGVLSGVVVRAVHEASGNSFEGVTTEAGHSAWRCASAPTASSRSWPDSRP